MGVNEQSIEQLREAFQSEEGKTDAGVRLAQRYADLGWLNEAMEVYKTLLEKYPDDFALLLEYGNLYFRRKDHGEAEAIFVKLTRLKPGRMEGWNNLGIVQLALNKADAARVSFEKVLEIEPDNAGALLNMGNYYQSRGDSSKAIELFEHAVDGRPDFADGWFNLGNACLAAKELDKAKTAYEKALRYQREFPSALKNLGYVYEQSGQLELAEKHYLQASAINKADASIQVNLANIYLQQQRSEDAKTCFLKAVRLAPRETAGWMGLRHLALLKGDVETYVRATLAILPRLDQEAIARSIEILIELDLIEKANELLSQADRLDKTSDELDAQRLMVYFRRKENPGKVIALYKRLSSLPKSSDTVKKILAAYALETGAHDSAIRFVNAIEEMDVVSHAILWRSFIAKDDFMHAGELIHSYLESNAECFEGWYLLAKIKAAQKNMAEAREYLSIAFEKGFADIEQVSAEPLLKNIYAELFSKSGSN